MTDLIILIAHTGWPCRTVRYPYFHDANKPTNLLQVLHLSP